MSETDGTPNRRWRLAIGVDDGAETALLCPTDRPALADALTALYGDGEGKGDPRRRRGGLGSSAPRSRAGWATSASSFPRRWCR